MPGHPQARFNLTDLDVLLRTVFARPATFVPKSTLLTRGGSNSCSDGSPLHSGCIDGRFSSTSASMCKTRV